MKKVSTVTKSKKIENYFGKKFAIDIIFAYHKFKYAVVSRGISLTDSNGNSTDFILTSSSIHLKRFFDGTKGLLVNGIKPVYVFDGQNDEDATSKKILTPKEIDEIKRLLRLMRIPFLNTRNECATMIKNGEIYGVATAKKNREKFGAKILLDDLPFQMKPKKLIKEIQFDKDSFTEHANEQVIELKWGQPDEENLTQFLCHEKQFNEELVREGIEKIKEALEKFKQSPIINFFKKSTKEETE